MVSGERHRHRNVGVWRQGVDILRQNGRTGGGDGAVE